MATTTAGPAVDLAPEQRQSVRLTLRSPRHLKTEVLAGLVVALALIPEAIAFSIIAGVDPRLGLFASFTMAVTTSVLGGRPAMVSAATGAVALVIAPLVDFASRRGVQPRSWLALGLTLGGVAVATRPATTGIGVPPVLFELLRRIKDAKVEEAEDSAPGRRHPVPVHLGERTMAEPGKELQLGNDHLDQDHPADDDEDDEGDNAR